MSRLLRFSPLLLSVLMLAGCEDWSDNVAARDFNELIPRFMGALNRQTPEAAAENLFNVTSPDERRDAIAYLEVQPWGHQPPYMKAYHLLMTDPHPLVRAQAMRALGTSYQASAVDDLVKGLSDPEATVRRDAAAGLMETYGEAATLPLTDIVRQDPDDQTRINAARALSHADTKDSIAALIAALNDKKDSAVCYYAHESLQTTARQDFGYDGTAWVAWYQQTYNPTTATAPATGPR